MNSTVSGMVTFVKPVEPRNALGSMLLTILPLIVLGITNAPVALGSLPVIAIHKLPSVWKYLWFAVF